MTDDSAGVIEIVSIPRMFYTRTYGAPDILFHSLLTSAREAYAVGAATTQQQGNPGKGVGVYAERYMAGLLLCDENFVTARVVQSHVHRYSLDFLAGTFQLLTEIHAVHGRSSSLFTVKLEGRIQGSDFVVRNSVTDQLLSEVSEEEIKKPSFFARELPFISYHVHLNPELAAPISGARLVDQSLELHLSIPPVGKVKTVVVQKDKGETQGEVRDAETGQHLCHLPLDALNNLGQMVETLRKVLVLPRATAN